MFKDITIGNTRRFFDSLQQERLGLYVYALVDPRDGKIFYVGQGSGNRLFDHFNDAEKRLKTSTNASSKEIRILDIWKGSENVMFQIIAHKLSPDAANATEAAVIDAMSISPNGQTLNEIRGPRSSMLTEGEVTTLGAKPISPATALKRVFIFPVHNALSDSTDNIYQATRASWAVTKYYRDENVTSFAVGVKNGISVGGFTIDKWEPYDDKHAFVGKPEETLINFDWKTIISQAIGYWQRGNYLIIEFDGAGHFRFLRGSSIREWLSV